MSRPPNPWLRTTRGWTFTWAHRAGGMEMPSNTEAAARHALSLGEPGEVGLEIDLQPTLDLRLRPGHPDGIVVFHDGHLDGTTEATGLVRDHVYAELGCLNPAHWWRPGT